MGSKLKLDYELPNHPLLKRSERCIGVFTPKQLADFKDFCESCESMGITRKPDPLAYFREKVNPDPEIAILDLIYKRDLTKNAYFHELVMSVLTMEDFSLDEFSKKVNESPEFMRLCDEVGHPPLEVFSVALGYAVSNNDFRSYCVVDGKTYSYSTRQLELLEALDIYLREQLFPLREPLLLD
ncbi:MAG: hypothetical protein V1861_00550 [Candidatus Micrarchaeota archaeon]